MYIDIILILLFFDHIHILASYRLIFHKFRGLLMHIDLFSFLKIPSIVHNKIQP